jgi:parallel beta-helix repeat protein
VIIKPITQVGAVLAVQNSSSSTTLEVRSSGTTTNIFIGLNSGANNMSSGINNTAVGGNALQGNTTGQYNSAFGASALQSDTTGKFNSAFGATALQGNTTGNYNSAFGTGALTSNSTGVQNTAVGDASLTSNTTGSLNVAFGEAALIVNSTGSRNTGIGSTALSSNTTGTNNTGLGYQADVGAGNLQNSTVIGTNSYVTASNSLVLGCVSGTNGCTTTTKVGIGNTAPVALFSIGSSSQFQVDINGNVNMNNLLLSAGSSISLVGGITGTRPASPTEGMLYYDTSTHQLLQYNGSKWVSDRSPATKIIAPSNASQTAKDSADVVLTGTADQTLINTALTAAAGGKVYILEGQVNVTGSISVPNNTTLAGAGAGTTIKLPNSSAANIKMIINTDATTGTGVVVQDLRLDGNNSNQTNGGLMGIVFTNMGGGVGATLRQGAKVNNVWFDNMTVDALELITSANTTIVGNTFENVFADGVWLNASKNNTISGNLFQGVVDYGVNIDDTSSYTTVTGNTFEGGDTPTGGFGGVDAEGPYNTISGNTFANLDATGVSMYTSNNNTVTGNTFHNNGQPDVQAYTSYNTISNNNMSDNLGNNGGSIDIIGSYNTITGNNIKNSGGALFNDAIALGGSTPGSDSNTITGNTITDTTHTTNNRAISLYTSLDDNNYIANNSLGGGIIYDLGTGTAYSSQIDGSGNMRLSPGSTGPVAGFGLTVDSTGDVQVQGTSSYGGYNLAVTSPGGVAAFNTTNAGAGATVIAFLQSGTVQGTVSINGATTSYNAFTGSHYAKIDSGTLNRGELASLTGNNAYAPGAGEPVYGITKTSTANDPNVLGAFLGIEDEQKGFSLEYPYLVMAAGNGDMWIADNGTGNVTIGDPLISSSIAGHAMRDPKTFAVSHVFAKAAETIDWSTVTQTINGVKVAKISVLFSFYDADNISTHLQGAALDISGHATLGSLTVTGSATIQGKLTVLGDIETRNIVINGHIITSGNAPQVVVGQGAGGSDAGGNIAAPTVIVEGNDTSGTITVKAGANGLADILASVTFDKPFDSKPRIMLTPANQDSAQLGAYYDASTATINGFDIKVSTAPQAGKTYIFNYFVVQ